MPQIRQHANARLTPIQRREIQESDEPARVLARRYGVSVPTIGKWRMRAFVHDLPHTRHNLHQSTTPLEEEIIVSLKQDLDLSLDDMVEVLHRCVNASLSRSAVYRCLIRNGVDMSRKRKKERHAHGVFEYSGGPGYIHMDTKHLPGLGKRTDKRYVLVAIDRATRYVYVEVHDNLRTATTRGFVERFAAAFPCEVHTILTDNGMEWTDRCSHHVRERGTGRHEVDRACKTLGIKHRLTRIRSPQTNGMVERFNRRLNEAIAMKKKVAANGGKNSFSSNEERNRFILQFVHNYNRTRLRCLNYQAPLEALNNHAGDNTNAGIQF